MLVGRPVSGERRAARGRGLGNGGGQRPSHVEHGPLGRSLRDGQGRDPAEHGRRTHRPSAREAVPLDRATVVLVHEGGLRPDRQEGGEDRKGDEGEA